MKKCFLQLAGFLLLISSHDMAAQKTPEALGDTIFKIFKSKNISRLDAFIPTIDEVMEIFRAMGLQTTVTQQERFPEKYSYHTGIFKKKCAEAMIDTTELNINWSKAVLGHSESIATPIRVEADSVNAARTLTRHALNIYFSTGQKHYVIRFRDIYPYKDTWKLGENVGFRQLEADGIREK